MVDLRIMEIREQFEILKLSYDEGIYYDNSFVEDVELGTDDNYIIPLAETNRLLLDNIYSDVVCGNVGDDYEYLEAYHEFLDNAIDDFYTKSEFSYYIFNDPLLDRYSSLIEKTRSVLTKEEFAKFRHGCISSLGVVLDYVYAIDRDIGAFDSMFSVKEGQLYWMILLDSDFDFILNGDVVWWSHLLMKLVKRNIPAMERFLQKMSRRKMRKEV